MQRGRIYRHHGSWLLQFYDDVLIDGKRVRKRACVKLAPANDDYPNKRSVLLLAEKHLAPLNSGHLQPESAMSVCDFIEKNYLPYVEKELRPSTLKHYKKDIFEKHVKDRLGNVRLRDFRTVHGQKILRAIPNAGRRTLVHVKVFLSGVFKHAKREGILDGVNPMQDVSVPGRPVKFNGAAYSIDEIERMLIAGYDDDGTAKTAIATAALTGLRLSELRALRWSDFDGENLHVKRSIWRTHVGPTKTAESEGTVPVLPLLQKVLEKHRKGAPDSAYIFAGERRGAPLNLANLAARTIKPALQKAAKEKPSLAVNWQGWHAFRRGLASNLYALGVQPKVIQAILRHSDIGTTLAYYVATPDEETREALEKIEAGFPFGL